MPADAAEIVRLGEPHRVQLSRKKGWRMPENTVSVARPGPYGNQFVVGRDGTAQECVDQYRADWEAGLAEPKGSLHRALYSGALAKLRGKNLACWCKLGEPCHADVLLELANRPAQHDHEVG
ncbi:DUF4326 domain-containing protein [uncultured Sphingomonas sp.]|uniref:DUF4326 domain-containing protein n=1 Tax=uncultured Sphingomonas sp. TaxID=158754 RepID=UPI0030F77391